MWMLIGIALLSAFQQGPISGFASLVLMLAATCEAVLARHAFKDAWRRLWRRWFPVFNRSAWLSAHHQKARRRAAAAGQARGVKQPG